MALGLGIVVYWATQSGPAAAIVSAFKSRVIADGGTVESPSCAKSDVKFLLDNPVPSAFTGLLDTYSGAAAAYSLRQLSSTYSGDAIVVRRASDNTTQNIGFVNNELDTASLESFCSGTDGFVTTWYDQSGNGNDAAQATASSQPKIVSAGSTILENGKAALDFTGTEYLEVFSGDVRSGGYLELAVAASNTTTASTYAGLISHGANTAQSIQGYLGVRSSGTNWGTFDGTSRVFGATTGSQQIVHRYNDGANDTQTNKVDNVVGDVYSTTQPIRIGMIGHFTLTAGQYIGTAQEILLWGNQDGSLIESGVYNNVSTYY